MLRRADRTFPFGADDSCIAWRLSPIWSAHGNIQRPATMDGAQKKAGRILADRSFYNVYADLSPFRAAPEHKTGYAAGLRLLILLALFRLLVLGVEVDLIGFRNTALEVADGATKAAANLGQALGTEDDKAKEKDKQYLMGSKAEHS